MRFVVVVFFSLVLSRVTAQEQVVDPKAISSFILVWAEAHNQRKVVALEKLYDEKVIFYGEQLPRASCLEIKSKRLQSKKYFRLMVMTRPTVKVYSSGLLKVSFVKRVTSGEESRDYDAYLVLRKEGTKLLIAGESDLITDDNAGYVLDLGKELSPPSLSGAPSQEQSETEVGPKASDRAWQRLLYFIGFVIVGWLLYALVRRVRQDRRNTSPMLRNDNTRTDRLEKVGREFEEFIVNRFDRKYFDLQDWQGDKRTNGIYPKSNLNPDLVYEFKFAGALRKFAVECKFRTRLIGNKISFDERQLNNYRKFQEAREIKVYIALGIGGTPSVPVELFVIPLDRFKGRSELSYESVLDCYDNPAPGNKFYFDLVTDSLQTYRKKR